MLQRVNITYSEGSKITKYKIVAVYRQPLSNLHLLRSNRAPFTWNASIGVLTDWEAAWRAGILLSEGLYLAHEHRHLVVRANRGTSLQFSLDDVEPDRLDQSEVIVARAMNDG